MFDASAVTTKRHIKRYDVSKILLNTISSLDDVAKLISGKKLICFTGISRSDVGKEKKILYNNTF